MVGAEGIAKCYDCACETSDFEKIAQYHDCACETGDFDLEHGVSSPLASFTSKKIDSCSESPLKADDSGKGQRCDKSSTTPSNPEASVPCSDFKVVTPSCPSKEGHLDCNSKACMTCSGSNRALPDCNPSSSDDPKGTLCCSETDACQDADDYKASHYLSYRLDFNSPLSDTSVNPVDNAAGGFNSPVKPSSWKRSLAMDSRILEKETDPILEPGCVSNQTMEKRHQYIPSKWHLSPCMRWKDRQKRQFPTIRFENFACLIEAAAAGDLEEVRRLIQVDGIHPDTCNADGVTALHYAAGFGHIEITSLLIDHMANVNVADDEGWTPLHNAAYASDHRVCQLLIAAGADLDARNIDGQVPIDIATDMELFKVLAEAMQRKQTLEWVVAIYDFDGNKVENAEGNELSFKRGTKLRVLRRDDPDWWFAEDDKEQGFIPRQFVQ